jgi:restriction system protein
MPVPDFQQFMFPVLLYLQDDETRNTSERREWLANYFKLSEEERAELLPSGKGTKLNNRHQWAAFYLRNAGLLSQEGRGLVRITVRGHKAIQDAKHGHVINNEYLKQFPEFLEFLSRSSNASGEKGTTVSVALVTETPEEAIQQAYLQLRSALASDLLDKIKASSPSFFEQLVIDLLVAMGYGGSRADAAQAVGGSGDGGVDGYIKEDKLGLDSIYLQAKRWESAVGRPTVQAFAGSLEGFRAHKGVLITTSAFTSDAQEYVRRIAKTIVLINGTQLTALMIDHGVGVTDVAVYPVKRIDEDYFADT